MITEITVPVLNEEKTLAENIRRAQAYVRTDCGGHDVTLVIADNGSTDSTAEIGQALAAAVDHVRFVHVPERGVGRALQYSWGQSSADIVGYMDLDLATDLRHIPEALDAIANGADIVYGTRLDKKSRVIGRALKREIVSRVFNTVLRVYLGANISDGMCGFKFLRRSLLQSLQESGAVSNGWFFSTELLIAGERLGYRLDPLPVRWTDDPNSHVKIVKLTLEYLRAMQRIKSHPVRTEKSRA